MKNDSLLLAEAPGRYCRCTALVLASVLAFCAVWPSHQVAWGQQARPFSATEIEDLIKSGVSQARVAGLIEERGVNFEITAAVRAKLQTVGAGSNIIATLEKASGKYVNRREEAKRKEEEKRIAEEARRKLVERRVAEEKGRIEDVRRQQEEELRRAEIEKRQREAALSLKREALAKRKSEQETLRREEERKREEETHKKNQELARLKKLDDARKIERLPLRHHAPLGCNMFFNMRTARDLPGELAGVTGNCVSSDNRIMTKTGHW